MRKLKNEELKRLTAEDFKNANKTPVVLVLDNVRSIYNVGSVFRTADSFLVNAIYLCGITATPCQRELHKTSLGAEKSIQWTYFAQTMEAISELLRQQYTLIAIEQAVGSIPLQDVEFKKDKKYAFIFGNEIRGVQQAVVDKTNICIEIPQFGTKHSFNISVSTAIVLWEYFRQTRS